MLGEVGSRRQPPPRSQPRWVRVTTSGAVRWLREARAPPEDGTRLAWIAAAPFPAQPPAERGDAEKKKKKEKIPKPSRVTFKAAPVSSRLRLWEAEGSAALSGCAAPWQGPRPPKPQANRSFWGGSAWFVGVQLQVPWGRERRGGQHRWRCRSGGSVVPPCFVVPNGNTGRISPEESFVSLKNESRGTLQS